MTMRGTLQRLHRWLGLTLGVWFALLGLSGSVIVFWHEPEDASYPATMARATDGTNLPLQALLERLLEARPQADIYRISLPASPGLAMRLDFFDNRPNSEEVFRGTAYLDPVSGTVLGERVFGDSWVSTLYSLHSGLILGRGGIVAAGLVGLVLGVLALLGLLLWAYRDGRPWRESLAPMGGLRGLRRLRNWHRALGIWMALPLALAAITGAGLAFPETVRDLARPILPEPSPSRFAGPGRPGLDAAIARAEELLPGFRAVWIDLPLAGSKEATAIILRPTDGQISGPGVARFSPALGKQMEVTLASPVETLRAWIMALHHGQALGLGHRLFVVALGLVPVTMGLLGWLAWRRRLRARRNAVLPTRVSPVAAE